MPIDTQTISDLGWKRAQDTFANCMGHFWRLGFALTMKDADGVRRSIDSIRTCLHEIVRTSVEGRYSSAEWRHPGKPR